VKAPPGCAPAAVDIRSLEEGGRAPEERTRAARPPGAGTAGSGLRAYQKSLMAFAGPAGPAGSTVAAASLAKIIQAMPPAVLAPRKPPEVVAEPKVARPLSSMGRPAKEAPEAHGAIPPWERGQ